MLFLVRSAVCIGAVSMLATGGGTIGAGRFVAKGGQVAQGLGQTCATSYDCWRIGTGLAATLVAVDPIRPVTHRVPSADTLAASDLRPAWHAADARPAGKQPRPHEGSLRGLSAVEPGV